MESKQIELTCPCCQARLLVDTRTGAVLRARDAASQTEDAAPPPPDAGWGQAVGRVQARREGGEDKLAAALEREKRREEDLDDLFRRAKKRADEASEAPAEPEDAPGDAPGESRAET